jgi:hypothetical protein
MVLPSMPVIFSCPSVMVNLASTTTRLASAERMKLHDVDPHRATLYPSSLPPAGSDPDIRFGLTQEDLPALQHCRSTLNS